MSVCTPTISRSQLVNPSIERLDTIRVASALRAMINMKATNLRETEFTTYILKGWTSYLDTLRMDFRVDSIIGRGYNREVLVSRTVADTGSDCWHVVMSRDTTGWTYDSLGHGFRPLKYDTVEYLGNARRYGMWLQQEWAMFSPSYWGMSVQIDSLRYMVYRLRLWKVLGDPTVNNGFNQQCVFRASVTVQLDACRQDSLVNLYEDKFIR